MNWFERIKEYYSDGRWPIAWVRNAVKKGKITADQYKEITGDDYPDEAAE